VPESSIPQRPRPDAPAPAPLAEVYLLGDLLALARRSWVEQMASRLEAGGYPGYRRSDAAVLRLLRRSPASVGQLGSGLAVTRQAARKVADGLEARGYARTHRDDSDSRRLNIILTPLGEAYAGAVVEVVTALNQDLARRVGPEQLAAADAVLRAALATDAERQYAARMVRPPR
jgi:DNA-binding MarR family transcriptional regulator